MRADIRNRLAHTDRAKSGGWWCYGKCRSWTELDMDREQNVCAICGRPTVRLLPPAQHERHAHHARMVDRTEARELFQVKREAVEHAT